MRNEIIHENGGKNMETDTIGCKASKMRRDSKNCTKFSILLLNNTCINGISKANKSTGGISKPGLKAIGKITKHKFVVRVEFDILASIAGMSDHFKLILKNSIISINHCKCFL